MKLSQFAINLMIFSKKIVKTWRFTEFLHGGSCGNQISAWGVMQKSDSFSVVLWRFHEFFYRYRNLLMAIAYIDSYRNKNLLKNSWQSHKWQKLASAPTFEHTAPLPYTLWYILSISMSNSKIELDMLPPLINFMVLSSWASCQIHSNFRVFRHALIPLISFHINLRQV